MKSGYLRAAWRLLQPPPLARPIKTRPTWADTELAGTPFQPSRLPLPIVRPKGSH